MARLQGQHGRLAGKGDTGKGDILLFAYAKHAIVSAIPRLAINSIVSGRSPLGGPLTRWRHRIIDGDRHAMEVMASKLLFVDCRCKATNGVINKGATFTKGATIRCLTPFRNTVSILVSTTDLLTATDLFITYYS